VIKDINQMLSQDTAGQTEDLFVEFFSDKSMTPEAAQKKFAEIIANAD